MKIYLISGKAESGKDTFAKEVKKILKNDRVLVTHFADLVKYICTTFFGWNGEKDKAGRRMLQWVGTDKIRKKYPNFWVDFIRIILITFEDEWDYILIPDARFKNEIERIKDSGIETKTIRINRINHENVLTKEQRGHASETSLDNYNFDFIIENDGTKKFFENIQSFMIGEING